MTDIPLIIGVLGGMGPAATIDFMAKVLRHSQASAAREQDNVRMIVDSNPSLPDRNAAIAGTGPSPAAGLAAMARGLQAAGAQVLTMPCNAAHAFADAVTEARKYGEDGVVAVASFLLAPGFFQKRLGESGADYVTGPLAPHPRLVEIVLDRYRDAGGS